MKKIRNKYGFSMAELLMVVAILVALFGVAFVAVQRHQRSMTQLEYDTIAKEIFVAAQNHLTAAESQGYPGLSPKIDDRKQDQKYGTPDSTFSPAIDEVYYFAYPSPGAAADMLELMLPFGAIDETIRAGGSYLIRYQPSSGRVLDVFYSNKGHTAWLTTKGTVLTSDAFEALMTNCRKAGIKEYKGAVVGWYGDGDALPVGARLKAPQVLIHNEETLWVVVKDTNTTNTSGALVLVVTGETSEAKKMFNLYSDDTGRVSEKQVGSGEYRIVLDDITRLDSSTEKGLHFAEIVADTTSKFIPGENITIEAIAYNNGALTNIAYSGKGRTNSIFAEPSSYEIVPSADLTTAELNKVNGTVFHQDKTKGISEIAAISNFRHLENLDKFVSGWGKGETLEYISAVQLTNLTEKLSWTEFIGGKATAGDVVCAEEKSTTTGSTNPKKYWPVNLEKDFLYDGRGHSISDVVTDGIAPGNDKNQGLFRTLDGCTVQNLELIDFTIQSSDNTEDNAGALAGTTSDSDVKNILVRNSEEKDSEFSKNSNITANGSAGGLIGLMRGGSVTGCASAVYVSGNTNAGGLIGSASGGTVTVCYSGGHTEKATYYIDGTVQFDENGKPDPDCCIFNVKASGSAGGLIGSSSETDILYSYSTCSVTGSTAGGLVGNAAGTIKNSYATGLVSGTTEGAFTGSFSGTATDCHYYEIINERKDAQKGFTYVDPVSGEKSFPGITPLDASAQTYNDFSFPNASGYSWQPAVPYDEALKNYYKDQDEKNVYNLKTVKQLVVLDSDPSVSINDDDFVTTHYGDWPAPEIFVINAGTGSGNSGNGNGGAGG